VWVSVRSRDHDPERFWTSLVNAAHHAAPNDPLLLVIDDLHELVSRDALDQLQELLTRAPAGLQVVLSTRRRPKLGLHRLLLDGHLTEIGAADLCFTSNEARALFETAGLRLSDWALERLVERTEGWAAGLRMAALRLAGQPDPEQLAASFSGSDCVVAEYLGAEVLDRQPEEVRRLLLCTSLLETVNGPLADHLTGGSGSDRILRELEEANAFVVAVDREQSSFRCHRLFAEVLRHELRRRSPVRFVQLHGAAAEWFAEHGHLVDAIRHAQAAENWNLATRLLSDHWVDLEVSGQAATARHLLASLPVIDPEGNPEVAAMMAADRLHRGCLDETEWLVTLATTGLASLPATRRRRLESRLAVLRLSCAEWQGDVAPAIQDALRLVASAEPIHSARVEPALRALTLIELGRAELGGAGVGDADRHLAEAVALARSSDLPYLEMRAMAYRSEAAAQRSFSLATRYGTDATDLARRHGWTSDPAVQVAYAVLSRIGVWQGRFQEASTYLDDADRLCSPRLPPAVRLSARITRGWLELALGENQAAVRSFQAAERKMHRVVGSDPYQIDVRADLLHALLRSGQAAQVEEAVKALSAQEHAQPEMLIVVAALRLALGDPRAAAETVAPLLDGSLPGPAWAPTTIHAFLLAATAHDALGDVNAAEHALGRALELAEPDHVVLPFALCCDPRLLKRLTRHRLTYSAFVSDVVDLVQGSGGAEARPQAQPPNSLREALSDREKRVLRYLSTHLTAPEIANELYLSVNTVKTHTRHVYVKLGVNSRKDAVAQGRVLGLLAV
jgi:LuxR family maltose regulon positive regulatory protein